MRNVAFWHCLHSKQTPSSFNPCFSISFSLLCTIAYGKQACFVKYLWRALSISFFSWWASFIWWVTLARNSSKLDRRCGSSRLSWAQRLRTSPGLRHSSQTVCKTKHTHTHTLYGLFSGNTHSSNTLLAPRLSSSIQKCLSSSSSTADSLASHWH